MKVKGSMSCPGMGSGDWNSCGEQREAGEGGKGRESWAETLESFVGHFKEFRYSP